MYHTELVRRRVVYVGPSVQTSMTNGYLTTWFSISADFNCTFSMEFIWTDELVRADEEFLPLSLWEHLM